jgi:uncharacterized membrane protein
MMFTTLVILLVVLLIRWIYLRERFQQLEQRLEELQAAIRRMEWNARHPEAPAPAPKPAAAPVLSGPPLEPVPAPAPPVVLPVEAAQDLSSGPPLEPPVAPPEPAPPAIEPAPARSAVDWEYVIGGQWAHKIGVLIAVMALAFLLQYAWKSVGPAGRVALSYVAGAALLGGGMWAEARERFRTLGYGLIGGGWAAVYLTTFAMYGIPEARILHNAFVATILLLLVAAGMISHSLKYRSQTVTALASFIAFFSLAISDVTSFAVLALIPLAVVLLYIAWRYEWSRFALYGLLATYITCGLHKDTGAPLWQTQALFLAYWLLFEIFDLLRADPWLLPLNALGFLTLSAGKWNHAAPDDLWLLAAGASALYLASTVLRARSGRWRPAVAINAALATTAILLKLHDQWVLIALLILAELYFLAGVFWNSRWLRGIAACLFTLEIGHLLIGDLDHAPLRVWEPAAIATAAVFYLNRALRAGDVVYGYVAAGLAALVSGLEASAETRGRVWMLLSVVPFGFGWWRRQLDFRIQGYGFATIGAFAIALFMPYPPLSLAIAALVGYAGVHCVLWSAQDRFLSEEHDFLRLSASAITTVALAALVWKLAPSEYFAIGWLALAVLLFEAGLLDLPREFRWQAYLVGLLGVVRAIAFDLDTKLVLIPACFAYFLAFRAKDEEGGAVTAGFAFPGTLLLLAGLRAALPAEVVSTSWALVALALAEFDSRSFRLQALLVSVAVFVHCVAVDFGSSQVLVSVVPPIACYAVAVLRRPRGTYSRIYFSLLAAGLTATLIYHEVSGSMLTIAWGLEGVAVLGAGFPLGDRVLRLTGLAMLSGCIGKLFLWDLRNLDTLPRIFSLMILGALLIGVSWIYARFRESLQRYL